MTHWKASSLKSHDIIDFGSRGWKSYDVIDLGRDGVSVKSH